MLFPFLFSFASGAYEGAYTFASRFETAPGTNPEELIGAAIAGCYSMFLSALLFNDGFEPMRITTFATVALDLVYFYAEAYMNNPV